MLSTRQTAGRAASTNANVYQLMAAPAKYVARIPNARLEAVSELSLPLILGDEHSLICRGDFSVHFLLFDYSVLLYIDLADWR